MRQCVDDCVFWVADELVMNCDCCLSGMDDWAWRDKHEQNETKRTDALVSTVD